MKIKRLIFEALDLEEAAVSISQAESENLALLVIDTSYGCKMVLYDASVIDKMGPENWLHKSGNRQKLTGIIIGVISANKEPEVGAYEIDISAAVKGYGPLLYDMLSSHVGFIISDRIEISKHAQRVWKYIMTNRSDWEHEWIEKAEYRVTSYNMKKNPLNYRYRILNKMNLSSLRNNHKAVKTRFDDVDVERIILFEGVRYFDFRYEG